MAENVVEIPVKMKIDKGKAKSDVKDVANSFAERIQQGLSSSLNKLGIGSTSQFKPTSTVSDKGSSAVSTGIVAGLAAGGIISGISMIVDFLKDFPIITAIMKMVKMIMFLLFLPLIPLLKPVLTLLGNVIKIVAPFMVKLTAAIDELVTAWNTFVLKMWAGVWDNLKGLGTFLWNVLTTGWEVLKGIGFFIWNLITNPLGTLKSIGEFIWNNIILAGFNILLNAGNWIWTNTLKPAFDFLNSVGSWIWVQILQPAFSFLSNAGVWIWEQIINPSFQYLLDAGTWLWNIIKKPFEVLAGLIRSAYEWFSNSRVGRALGLGTTSVGDAIITPQGVVKTDPNDFIIATKNPSSMGGGMTVNINIDKPTLTSQADIKTLVKAIESELYKMNRRYNSYA